MNPEDELKLDEVGSTPQSEWDDFWTLTHKNTKASWDVVEGDDTDECLEDEYNDVDLLWL